MPTNFTVSSSGGFNFEELLVAHQEALQASVLPRTSYVTTRPTSGTWIPTNPKTTLQMRRQSEKAQVKCFIETGSRGQTIAAYENDGKLTVYGDNMGDSPTLFTIQDGVITAQIKRSKHLKTLLVKLAKREGMKLDWIDEAVPTSSGGRKIAYYAFNNLGEVDDSELFTAKAVVKQGFVGPCCDDPDCESNYPERHEDDELPF